TQLEGPRRRVLELPVGGEAGVELAVRVATGQVVEEVERDPDLVGAGAEVGIELRDVAALRGDQLFLWGLGSTEARACRERGPGNAQRRRALQQLAPCHVHAVHLLRETGVWRWSYGDPPDVSSPRHRPLRPPSRPHS